MIKFLDLPLYLSHKLLILLNPVQVRKLVVTVQRNDAIEIY